MKPIFKTDLCLVILFAASLLTGIRIHYANDFQTHDVNDFQTHDVWHTWSVIHFFVNIALLVTAIIHIKQHWGWFKTLFIPTIRVFSYQSVLHIRWPKYQSFSFSISPSNEYSGFIPLGLTGFEMSAIEWQFKHSLALPFFGIGMKTDLFQSCGHC